MNIQFRAWWSLAFSLLLAGCATGPRPELGLTDVGRLFSCPERPNCVSSEASDADRAIEPLEIGADAEAVWQALIGRLQSEPDFSITAREPGYLRAEARTPLFRFVDDVEFHLRADEGLIAMRSASRIGYWDLGANRRRLEEIRQALKDAGALADGS